jgi:flagellar basal-body rod protein FlgG
MAIQALYTAATGMDAMQTKLDVIANNLANVDTTGFKADRANFEDLFYRHEMLPGAQDANGQPTAVGIATGLGVRVSSTQTNFEQGSFEQTSDELDIAIEGNGFFQINDLTRGEILYTRAGNFSVNAEGNLVLGSASLGRVLEPNITIPPDTEAVVISGEGVVSVKQTGSPALAQVGVIELARFINPEGLLKLGDNLFAETDASGPPTTGTPGTDGLGLTRQNSLEQSNVDPVREMIGLITTQRAFELNSQAVQAGDQILQLIANLRRF